MTDDTEPKFEVLREVWRITERRGGATYRTVYVEDRWTPLTDELGRPDGDPDLLWVPKSDQTEPIIRRRTRGSLE